MHIVAKSNRPVLAVFAHPDDESLACGGTLARLADAGVKVIVMCASRGERGSTTGPARDDQLAPRRALEACEAAAALGIAHLIVLDHPDGDLQWAHVTELHAEIVMALRRYDPAAVITFGEDGLYWHLDHVGVHERTTTAVRSLGALAPPLYYVTMPRGAMRAIVDRAKARGWDSAPEGLLESGARRLRPRSGDAHSGRRRRLIGCRASSPPFVAIARRWARTIPSTRSTKRMRGAGSAWSTFTGRLAMWPRHPCLNGCPCRAPASALHFGVASFTVNSSQSTDHCVDASACQL